MKCRDVIGWGDGLGLRKAVGAGLGLVIKVMWCVEWVFPALLRDRTSPFRRIVIG